MTRKIRVGARFVLVAAAAFPVAIFAEDQPVAPPKEHVCRFLAQSPEIDGIVAADPAWDGVPPTQGFWNLRTGMASAKQTSFRMGYTVEALYLGIVCDEPSPEQIRADLGDGEYFLGEDRIGLYFCPDGRTLLQFAVNAIGSRYSSRTLKKWRAAVETGDDSWSVEIALPWEVIGTFPAQGDSLGFNLVRFIASQRVREESSWANLEYSTREVSTLARLQFEPIPADQQAAIIARIKLEAVKEEVLLYSRPARGLFVQSDFTENMVVFNQGPHVAPRLSPDGTRVLLNSLEGGTMGVWTADRAGDRKERLCDGGQATWSADGSRIVLVRDGRLIERDVATGEETMVGPEGAGPLANPSYAPERGMAGLDPAYRFVCTDEPGQAVFAVAAQNDLPLETLVQGEIGSGPRCSPDGSTLAFQDGAHIYLMDLATREVRQLTADPGIQACPVWAEDGQSLCYVRAHSPYAERWDICHVALADPHTLHIVEPGVHPGFDWSGTTPDSSRTANLPGANLTVRQGDNKLDLTQGLDPKALDTWSVVEKGTAPGPLGPAIVVENDWLYVHLSTDGIVLVPKAEETVTKPIALRVSDVAGHLAGSATDFDLEQLDGDVCALRATFSVDGSPLAATIRVPRTRPVVEIVTDNEAMGLHLEANWAFAIVPDRLANDLVVDAGLVSPGTTVPLPETPLVLGCLSGSDALVMVASCSGQPTFGVAADQKGRRLETLIAEGTNHLAVAVFAQDGMWQQPELVQREDTRQRSGEETDAVAREVRTRDRMRQRRGSAQHQEAGDWAGQWQRPFHAEWRMAVRGAETAYAQTWNVRDLRTIRGGRLPIAGAFDERPEAAIVYAWGGNILSNPSLLTPADVLIDLWGIAGYTTRLDVEGVRGYRIADEWVPFRELAVHSMDWHPAKANEESEAFGLLELMGSVFPVGTDGVRSFVQHMGGDALHILEGLDNRIVEYEIFLTDLPAFCQERRADDAQGFLGTVAVQSQDLLASGRGGRKTSITEATEALDGILAIIGTRDNVSLDVFKAFCKMPGNDEWSQVYDDFRSYFAAQEGRVWYNDTIRFELWYDDTFRRFAFRCHRILDERQATLTNYRASVQRMHDAAGRLTVSRPEFKKVGDEFRRKTRAILRRRYYLEGDWRGETPLTTGVLE